MNGNEFGIKLKLNLIAFIIATAGTLCFPQILNLKGNPLVFTNSIFFCIRVASVYLCDESLAAYH